MKTTVTTTTHTTRTVRTTVVAGGVTTTTETVTTAEGEEANQLAEQAVDDVEKAVLGPIQDFFARMRATFR